MYKIRNRNTGYYSSGGQPPLAWTETGKLWKTIGHLKNHLRMIKTAQRNKKDQIYPNCEIIEYELLVKATKSMPKLLDDMGIL